MNKYFIIDINEDGFPLAFTTNNLDRDFIKRLGITWHQSNEGSDFEIPEITDVDIKKGNRVIYIFDMSSNGSTNPEYKNLIGNFNFFTEDFYDDLTDFIQEHWWDIEMNIDESLSIKKFKDFD